MRKKMVIWEAMMGRILAIGELNQWWYKIEQGFVPIYKVNRCIMAFQASFAHQPQYDT